MDARKLGPYASRDLHTGSNHNQTKYNIHNIKSAEDGGDAYDLVNLAIAVPNIHDERFAEIDKQKEEEREEENRGSTWKKVINNRKIIRRSDIMSQEMTREELVELVETIRSVCDKKTNRVLSEEEHHALVMKFKKV